MLAHGAILRHQCYSAEELTAIAGDPAATDLAPSDVAMMAFAEKLARDASAFTRADVQSLRDHGLSDAEIFDIAATAAARCFFSKLLDALGAEAARHTGRRRRRSGRWPQAQAIGTRCSRDAAPIW